MKLAWTSRWLLSSAAMEIILANPEKRMPSVRITVMSAEDKDKAIKNGIWFGCKHHRADDFAEISPDTLYAMCCHWGHITLQCPDMDKP